MKTTRTVGKARCPRCGREGTLVIRTIGNEEYVYIRHGRKWCYIGPRRLVDINILIIDNKVRTFHTPENYVNHYIRNIVSEIKHSKYLRAIIILLIICATSVLIIMTNNIINTVKTESTLLKYEYAHCNFTKNFVSCMFINRSRIVYRKFRAYYDVWGSYLPQLNVSG